MAPFRLLRGFWSRLGLQARLTLGVGGVLLAVFVAGQGVATARLARDYRADLEREARRTVETLTLGVALYAATGDVEGIRALFRETAALPGVRRLAWTSAGGLLSVAAAGESAEPRAPLWFRRWVDLPAGTLGVPATLAGNHYGTLEIAFDATSWENRLWREVQLETGMALLTLAGLFFAIALLLRVELRTLARLPEVARRLARGDPGIAGEADARLAPEIRALFHALGQVADELQAALRSMARQQRELAEQLGFARELLHAIPIPVYFKDRQGAYQGVNPAWETFFGRAAHTMVGRPVADLYPDAPAVAAIHAAKDAELWGCEGPQIYEIDLPAAAGCRHCLYTKAVYRDADGQPAGIIGAILDLTELRETQRELERIRQAVESATDAIAVCDLQGRALFVNRAFTAFTGRDREAVNGLGGVAATLANPRLKHEVCPEVQAGRSWTGELAVVGRGGEPVPVLLRASPVCGPDGGQIGLMVAISDLSRLKRAEALTHRLGRILDDSLNEIYTFDAETLRFTQVNRGARRNLGYSEAELQAMTPLDIKPEYDSARFEALLAPLLEGRRDRVRFETLHRRRDGSEYPVKITLEYFPKERPPVFVAVAEDITERRAAEAALRRSEEKYRALVEANNDWLWEVDANGVYTYASPRVKDILGYAPEEVVGRRPFDFMPPDEARRVSSVFAELAAARKPLVMLENVNLHRDGRRVVLETSGLPVFDEAGRYCGYRGIDRDVTARRLAQEALWESEARFENMTANVPGMVFQCQAGPEGDVVFRYVSEGAWALCGEAPQALLEDGKRFLAHMPEADRLHFRQTLDESRRNFGGWNWEGRLELAGDVRWVSWRASPRLLNDGLLVWDGMAANVTDMKAAQLALERSRQELQALSAYLQTVREEEKARIAREIHDELGGTLTALKMDAYWIARRLPAGMDELQAKLATMLGLVDGAVQTTRRICTELRPTVLDDLGLAAAIEWQVAEFEKRTGIACRLERPSEDVAVRGEMAVALFRILQESLTNVARHAHASRVDVACRVTPEHVLLTVEDDGCGMPSHAMEAGHSHGLRGIRERVRHFGGHLTLAGAPGQGTRIVVQLPVQDTTVEAGET